MARLVCHATENPQDTWLEVLGEGKVEGIRFCFVTDDGEDVSLSASAIKHPDGIVIVWEPSKREDEKSLNW